MDTQANSSQADADARLTPAAVESGTGGDALPAPGKEKAPSREGDGEQDWLLVLLRTLGVWTV
jgi:hypothetical protein